MHITFSAAPSTSILNSIEQIENKKIVRGDTYTISRSELNDKNLLTRILVTELGTIVVERNTDCRELLISFITDNYRKLNNLNLQYVFSPEAPKKYEVDTIRFSLDITVEITEDWIKPHEKFDGLLQFIRSYGDYSDRLNISVEKGKLTFTIFSVSGYSASTVGFVCINICSVLLLYLRDIHPNNYPITKCAKKELIIRNLDKIIADAMKRGDAGLALFYLTGKASSTSYGDYKEQIGVESYMRGKSISSIDLQKLIKITEEHGVRASQAGMCFSIYAQSSHDMAASLHLLLYASKFLARTNNHEEFTKELLALFNKYTDDTYDKYLARLF